MAEISILIPIYNAEKYLEECLESIQNQQFCDFEVLMIVDGATDSSLNICTRFAESDCRFKVRSQENRGSGRTRNHAIDWAMENDSNYIVWVDADDIIHPMYLDHLYWTIKAHPECDIVQCRYSSVMDELLSVDAPCSKPIQQFSNVRLLTEMVSGRCGIDFTLLWNKIYKKELYQNVRMKITEYFSGRMQDDVNILSQIYKLSSGACLLDEKLYFYRIVANSIQHKKISEVNLEFLYIYRDLYLECKGTEFDAFADLLSERILFELASKFQKRKVEYQNYAAFYRQAKQMYEEFKGQIDFVCRRKDIWLLNRMAQRCFYAFRVYALLYSVRGKLKTLLRR